MNALVQRIGPAAILLAWGAALCTLAATGRLTAYLAPPFQPYTVICGGALVALAILTLLAPAGSGESGCAPARSRGKSFLGAGILVVPLALALLTSEDQFGATLVRNRTYVTQIEQLPAAAPPDDALPGESTTTAEPQAPAAAPAGGPVKAEVIDLLYAAQLPEMRPTFENKTVELIGQLMPAKESNPHGDRYDLVRMFMTCCAADVQPIAIAMQPAEKPTQPEMTWVKASGTATFPVIDGQRRPLLENVRIEKTDPPEDAYLY